MDNGGHLGSPFVVGVVGSQGVCLRQAGRRSLLDGRQGARRMGRMASRPIAPSHTTEARRRGPSSRLPRSFAAAFSFSSGRRVEVSRGPRCCRMKVEWEGRRPLLRHSSLLSVPPRSTGIAPWIMAAILHGHLGVGAVGWSTLAAGWTLRGGGRRLSASRRMGGESTPSWPIVPTRHRSTGKEAIPRPRRNSATAFSFRSGQCV